LAVEFVAMSVWAIGVHGTHTTETIVTGHAYGHDIRRRVVDQTTFPILGTTFAAKAGPRADASVVHADAPTASAIVVGLAGVLEFTELPAVTVKCVDQSTIGDAGNEPRVKVTHVQARLAARIVVLASSDGEGE